MAILNYLSKQHKYTIVSTALLSVAALPLLFVSSYGYILALTMILARGLLLYGIVTFDVLKDHEEYAIQVVSNESFRQSLTGTIARSVPLTEEKNRKVNTFRLNETATSFKFNA